jgi:hypothetical protein
MLDLVSVQEVRWDKGLTERAEDYQDVDRRMRSEWILGRVVWRMWIGFDWLRTGTGGGIL